MTGSNHDTSKPLSHYNSISWSEIQMKLQQSAWAGSGIAAVECNLIKEIVRQLKEQFIYGLTDDDMMIKLRKITM